MKRAGFFIAALTAGAAFAGAAQARDCQGTAFGGDYIVQPHPSLVPITPEQLNGVLKEDLVRSIESYPTFALVTPADPAMDCELFMEKMNETGLVKKIHPNWVDTIQKLGRPQP